MNFLCRNELNALPRFAVAVSGGADSMALFHILRDAFPGKELFAYTVDHGLRGNSAAEARQVHEWLSPFSTHRVLQWMGDKPDTALQENARAARYALLAEACTQDDVTLLCLAHHRDDQAETILHRLAKGSGLDGLGGMSAVRQAHGVTLLRPLLDASHEELLAYCRDHAIAWIEDPSNENDKFARVRLRQAREALEAEGLTNERLARLATRMARAKDALDFYAADAFARMVDLHDAMAVIAADARTLPDEIYLRLVLKAATYVCPEHMLTSRLERLETLLAQTSPWKATLGLVTFDAAVNGSLRLTPDQGR